MMLSDEDLDCLFRAWTVPQSPDSMERRIRQAYRDRNGNGPGLWTRWVASFRPLAGLFAGITAGAVVFLMVIAQAFPQSLGVFARGTFPLTVDYELIEYKADGSSAIREYYTSANGMVLSTEFPGDPVRTAGQRILDQLNLVVYWIATPVRERQVARAVARIEALKATHPELAERERTCTLAGDPWIVPGHEVILGHPTTLTQKEWIEGGKPVRFTQWAAPDLHCATLKSTTEKTSNGRFRLAFEQRALKVTMNAPAARGSVPR